MLATSHESNFKRMVIVDETGGKKARRDRGNASHCKSPGIFASLPPILGLQDTHEQPIMGAAILFLYVAGGKQFHQNGINLSEKPLSTNLSI